MKKLFLRCLLKINKFVIFTLASFVLSFSAGASPGQIAQQKVIRVYISNAPGMGHQSASVVVMRRLRQLGFKGTFEVIYNDAIAPKLSTLLPGFSPQQSDWQEVPDIKVKAIAESRWKQAMDHTIVPLAITGADDNRKNMNPEKMFSESYILLEPQGWGDSFLFQRGAATPKVIPGLAGLGFSVDVDDSFEIIEKEIQTMQRTPEFSQKAAGLRLILNQPALFGAIYGVGLIPNMPERIRIWIEGIQMAERSLKFSEPVVLPIISPLNDYEMENLKWQVELLNQNSKQKRKVFLAKLEDASELSEIQKKLKSGDVLVIQTGRLPQTLFEVLFKKSELPVLVAGKNAMNLAQALGKSYINTVNDYGFNFSKTPSAAEKLIREASEVFHFSKSEDSHIRKLSKFIQQALNPESEISMHFNQLGAKKDKVAEALHFLDLQSERSCSKIFN